MSIDRPAYLIVSGMIAGIGLRRTLVREGRALGLDIRMDLTRRHPEVSSRLRRLNNILGLGWLLWGDSWEVITGPIEDVTRLKSLYDETWLNTGRTHRRAMVLGAEEEDQLEIERLLEGAMRAGR